MDMAFISCIASSCFTLKDKKGKSTSPKLSSSFPLDGILDVWVSWILKHDALLANKWYQNSHSSLDMWQVAQALMGCYHHCRCRHCCHCCLWSSCSTTASIFCIPPSAPLSLSDDDDTDNDEPCFMSVVVFCFVLVLCYCGCC